MNQLKIIFNPKKYRQELESYKFKDEELENLIREEKIFAAFFLSFLPFILLLFLFMEVKNVRKVYRKK